MSEPDRPQPLAASRAAACLAWILAVSAAYCAAYAVSLILFARSAAPRFPALARILQFLGLQ